MNCRNPLAKSKCCCINEWNKEDIPMLKDLVKTCRSYRRFFEAVPIPMDALRDMGDTARLPASAANAQALRFVRRTEQAVG